MKYVKMKEPKCGADIGDGSERAEYVPQEYLLKTLGRPSRAISLMYEYHPNDKNWPEMGVLVNKLYKRNRRTNGYFPYMAIHEGCTNCEPFKSISDIRKYGQDVQLTMTFDIDTPEEHLVQIAKDLRPFGEVILRINHECNGHWFTYNKINTFKEVSDFFVNFHNILKKYSPNVKTNACFNGVNPDQTDIKNHMGEDELAPAFRIADVVSFDYYHSLHWGWPHDGYDPVKYGINAKIKKVEKAYKISNKLWWEMLFNFYELMLKVNNGKEKNIYICEANTDADIDGLQDQADWIQQFYTEIEQKNLNWLKGITYYQFRDRGGLGLEYELDEDITKGRSNPGLEVYKKFIKKPYFYFQFEEEQEEIEKATLEWKSATNARGVCIDTLLPYYARKCFIEFSPDLNLIVEVNNNWFHKPCDTSILDISEVLNNAHKLKINIFAPPPTGENLSDPENADYLDVYKCRIDSSPKITFK